MQASNGHKKETTMSALSDRAEAIETQRQRLHDGIQKIYDVAHAYCACPDSEIKRIIDEEFEASLRSAGIRTASSMPVWGWWMKLTAIT